MGSESARRVVIALAIETGATGSVLAAIE